LKTFLALILGQILSNNFHVRTYVEATLIKLYNLLSASRTEQNGLNEPEVVQDTRIASMIEHIHSIIRPIVLEFGLIFIYLFV
jgi:hypothetical protein